MKAAASVPGGALCFAGVGYDALHLALYKFMPRKDEALITEENTDLLKNIVGYIPHPENSPRIESTMSE